MNLVIQGVFFEIENDIWYREVSGIYSLQGNLNMRQVFKEGLVNIK